MVSSACSGEPAPYPRTARRLSRRQPASADGGASPAKLKRWAFFDNRFKIMGLSGQRGEPERPFFVAQGVRDFRRIRGVSPSPGTEAPSESDKVELDRRSRFAVGWWAFWQDSLNRVPPPGRASGQGGGQVGGPFAGHPIPSQGPLLCCFFLRT